ncbi:MAG: hypothetical protein ABII23_00815 [bacterium]
MIKKTLFVTMVCMVGIGQIQAGSFFGGIDPQNKPSVINYGWAGLKLGALFGSAVGGVQAAEEHDRLDSSGEAKRVLNGGMYGLIGGTVLGMGIGFYDLSQGQTGVGAIILRDMWMGGGIGLVVGAAVGGITYSKTSETSDIGRSIAWGYIGGTIMGFGFGLIEGPKIASNPYDEWKTRIRFAMMPDSDMMLSPGIALQHKF